MSHIPASAMPHAKPHEEPEPASDAPATAADRNEVTPASIVEPASEPEVVAATEPAPPVPAPTEARPAPDAKPAASGKTPTLSFATIATIGVLAIGGLVAALALRDPKPTVAPRPKGKDAKAKGGRPRKVRDPS